MGDIDKNDPEWKLYERKMQLEKELAGVRAERDELRARIDGAVRGWGREINGRIFDAVGTRRKKSDYNVPVLILKDERRGND